MFIHDRSKGLVRAFRDLPMHVVVTCLAETVVLGDDRNGQVVTRVMLTGKKLPAQIGAFFNLVGFTYRISGPDGGTAYRVLFEGRADIDTKGMPGLRKREEPDVTYWLERALHGAPPRDPSAKMIVSVEAFGVPVVEAESPQEASTDGDEG